MSIYYREDGDEPLVSMAGFALLMGVDLDVFTKELERQRADLPRRPFRPPLLWVQQGKRRRKEYEAATGRTDMRGAIDYWAGRDV